jgi:hypothetical protein
MCIYEKWTKFLDPFNRKLDIDAQNSYGQTAEWLAFHLLQGNDDAVTHIRHLFNEYKKNTGQEYKDGLK